MDDIVIYPSKGKMATLAFGSLAMAAMCGATVVYQKEMEVPDFGVAVGVLGAIILGICSLWAFIRLFNPTPSVIVNREGITDNSSGTSVGLIRWAEIEQLTTYKMNYTTNLGIIVSDPESVFRRQSAGKAALLRSSWKLTNVPISIPQSTLPVSAEDLARQIIAYRASLPVAAAAAAPPPPAVFAPPPPVFASPQPAAPPAPPVALGPRCPHCGASSHGTKFCEECGQPMAAKSACDKCGAALKTTSIFCPDCGMKV
jgi:hypothetical protein